eukprot:g5008.t1
MTTPTTTLDASFLERSQALFDGERRFALAQNAVTRADPAEVTLKRGSHPSPSDTNSGQELRHAFSVRLSKEMRACNQRASGRCWIFACLNTLRNAMAKKYDLPDDFELSQTYVFFFDKLERVHYTLRRIAETAAEPLDGRLVTHLLADPMCDGGQWDMLVNVITKYGVVPKQAMGEAWSSTMSRRFNTLMTAKIREWAETLRGAADAGARAALLPPMLEETHRLLLIHFGTPPKTFDWTFHTKKGGAGSFRRFAGCTPLSFYADHVPVDVASKVSLVHDPRNEYWKAYTVSMLGNVEEGNKVFYLNVPIDVLKKCALQTLRADEPVWFGCDSRRAFHRKTQTWDTEQFDLDLVFGTAPAQGKAARLRYGESLMTHAMVFSAADVVEGEELPRTWRVENSWGEDMGAKGYAYMTDAYWNEFMYQVVVSKELAGAFDGRLKALIEAGVTDETTALPPWDPMGSLARAL